MEYESRKTGWLWQRNKRTQNNVKTVAVEVQATPEKNQDECRHYTNNTDLVILDVGGEKFTASRQSLFKFPTTR